MAKFIIIPDLYQSLFKETIQDTISKAVLTNSPHNISFKIYNSLEEANKAANDFLPQGFPIFTQDEIIRVTM